MNPSSLATCIACLLLLLVLGQAAASSDVVMQSSTASRKLLDGVPVHGNYCGPRHGKPGSPTVDDMDVCCKAHDNCYEKDGYFNCHCDMKLVDCLYYNTKIGPLEVTKRAKRKAIQLYFSNVAKTQSACSAEAKAQATKLKLDS